MALLCDICGFDYDPPSCHRTHPPQVADEIVPIVPIEMPGERTVWFTPDGDGWETREGAIEIRANHDGQDPEWVQRVDEIAHEPESVAMRQERAHD